MEYTITEYKDYNEQEILPLYESVGWINYIRKPQMLKYSYLHSLKSYAAFADSKLVGVNDENFIYDWWHYGSWKNNCVPTAQTGFAE